MELIFVNYKPKNKNVLLMELGTRNNKLCGLLTDKIPDAERLQIISSKTIIDALSVDRKIRWIAAHCPISYKLAYREMKLVNANVISRHSIKS